jgi:isocitrate/isopropylmalate dehydrogenase
MNKRIVILGGDGVGPEVAAVASDILKEMSPDFEITEPPCGEPALERYGTSFPEETKRLCDEADAVLFGAAGGASVPVLIYLRWDMDNYVNIRPVKYYSGSQTPLKDAGGIDFVILRENSEGLYPPREGDLSFLAERLPEFQDRFVKRGFADFGAGKFAVRVISIKGSQRMMQFACEFTAKRKKAGFPGKLTCVTKANVLSETDGVFYAAAENEITNYSQLTLEHFYVDDMSRRLIRYPKDMDVIVVSNMFGDILSDEAAELVGGMGMAASGCIGGKTPYFEPVHGSAPKYAGKNIINPTAMILSAKMMLDHLGLAEPARALEDAVAAVYREGKHLTQDQKGKATTTEFAKAVLDKLG